MFFKLKALVLPIFVLSFLFGGNVHAFADIGTSRIHTGAEAAGYQAGADETTLASIIGTFIQAILSVVGAVFLVLIFYAGFQWMTAHGEDSIVEKSKDMIRSAIIGLVIVVGSYSITSFVVPKIIERTTGEQIGGSSETSDENAIWCCIKKNTDRNEVVDKHVVNNPGMCIEGGGSSGDCPGWGIQVDEQCSVEKVSAATDCVL